MSSFENLRIVDNFYQTSLFFPMPTVIISTLCDDGSTTLGPYSLVQPYYVAGKDYYAMLLSCRNSSNTAQNILKNGKCTLNFIDDKPAAFKEAVKLSWPGDKPEDKMPKCNFKLEKSLLEEETGEARPMVLTDAIQACYDRFYPPFHKRGIGAPAEYSAEAAKNRAMIAEKYGFADIRWALYHRTRTFTAEEYVQLLGTYSDHIALEESVRREFFAAIRDAINEHGGLFTIYDTIDLQLARKP